MRTLPKRCCTNMFDRLALAWRRKAQVVRICSGVVATLHCSPTLYSWKLETFRRLHLENPGNEIAATQAFHHLTDDVLHDPKLMPQDAKLSQFLEKKVGVMIIWSLKVFRTCVFWFLIIMSFLERPCKQDRFICCCVLMAFIINAMIF